MADRRKRTEDDANLMKIRCRSYGGAVYTDSMAMNRFLKGIGRKGAADEAYFEEYHYGMYRYHDILCMGRRTGQSAESEGAMAERLSKRREDHLPDGVVYGEISQGK